MSRSKAQTTSPQQRFVDRVISKTESRENKSFDYGQQGWTYVVCNKAENLVISFQYGRKSTITITCRLVKQVMAGSFTVISVDPEERIERPISPSFSGPGGELLGIFLEEAQENEPEQVLEELHEYLKV